MNRKGLFEGWGSAVILVGVALGILIVLTVVPNFIDDGLDLLPFGQETLCKTDSDCTSDQCCSGYTSTIGADAGYARCRDKEKYSCD